MEKSLLITGSNPKKRLETALEIAAKVSAKFDIVEFDTAEKKGLELVKEATAQANTRPFNSKVKTIIVSQADNLNEIAQNALLKILEEPPATTQFILTSSSRENLLKTVVSRCSNINLESEKDELGNQKQFENFLNLSFADKLDLLEKTDLTDYLFFWKNLLKEHLTTNKLKLVHRYNKLILRTIRAEKSLANRRLLSLLLVLEIPTELSQT